MGLLWCIVLLLYDANMCKHRAASGLAIDLNLSIALPNSTQGVIGVGMDPTRPFVGFGS